MVPTQSEAQRPDALRPATLRRGRRRSDERGAVLVETAFIIPILLLLVFGVIETSLAFQSSAKVTDAARSVGRTVAAMGSGTEYVPAAGDAAQAALSSLASTSTPVTMLIYRPNVHGLPGTTTKLEPLDLFVGCLSSGTCTVMHWDGDTGQFVQSYWDPENPATALLWDIPVEDTCGPDYGAVGVIIFASHKTITDMFSGIFERDGSIGDGDINPNFKPMWDRAIFHFDPDLAADCS